MDPLHATLEEFAAEGYTHVSYHCPRCRMTRIRPMGLAPQNLDGAHARSAFEAIAMR
jgi:hypothetical protein